MKSKKWKILLFVVTVLCALFGIGSGIYIEFSDNSQGDDNTTNWKKGFFRLAVVFSIIVGMLGGILFSHLAKKGELADEDDGDPPPKHFTDPKPAFLVYFSIFFGCVWLGYFIIQWPVYYTVIFVLKGFTS